MDFILIVILMAVLYIVPEVLKRKRKPERYEYPDIPLPAPQPAKLEPEPVMASEELSTRTLWTGQDIMAKETPTSKKKTVEEIPSLQSVISQESLINGVIFAEIIRPPRAYRPMRRRL